MAVEAVLVWLGNLTLGYILGRARPGVRLDTTKGVAFYSAGGGFQSYRASLCIYAAGRATFTVREAGWIAADGFELGARIPDEGRTLSPGGPEVCGSVSAGTVAKAMREHRGLTHVFVLIVGRDKRFTFPVSNEWRVRLTEAEAKSGAY